MFRSNLLKRRFEPNIHFFDFSDQKKLGLLTLSCNRFLELTIKNIGKVRPWLCNMGVIVSDQGLTLPNKSPTAEKKWNKTVWDYFSMCRNLMSIINGKTNGNIRKSNFLAKSKSVGNSVISAVLTRKTLQNGSRLTSPECQKRNSSKTRRLVCPIKL